MAEHCCVCEKEITSRVLLSVDYGDHGGKKVYFCGPNCFDVWEVNTRGFNYFNELKDAPDGS